MHCSLFFAILTILLAPQYITANASKVTVGIDVLLNSKNDYLELIHNKRIGLITNHTAINGECKYTKDLLKANAKKNGYTLAALFAPEHGINGSSHNWELISDSLDQDGIPIFSLHGKTMRPTAEMLEQVDILLYDIQDIGARSYTYITTLFYVMEEAAKYGLPVIVLDRPNPINGIVVDGPMLEEKWRSIVGYINVPYCHGMTIGELAQFFNVEYNVGCRLTVVPMKGWDRRMSFHDTGLTWIPTSPNIPEETSPYYYPVTGLLGELELVSIGIGYTLPFKIVGAPWINAEKFAKFLNAQKFPGIHFMPFHFRPYSGRFKQEDCQGVLILVTNPLTYKPVCTQYLIIGILKSLYQEKFKEALAASHSRKDMFCKVNGTEKIYRIMQENNHIVWTIKSIIEKENEQFLLKRKKYLIKAYGSTLDIPPSSGI